ncbi:unnamed protein product [Caenorhabditis auriculariae]|uniref:Aminopeptidase N-like N-terminal domain-containing protein n=1 Tax=Caenorhabditis auriculariae TaxID=2777116 RepID=A0A8S1HAI9_9PELO|nr:unnamed protein product [Caenorhabditis auriculariae]
MFKTVLRRPVAGQYCAKTWQIDAWSSAGVFGEPATPSLFIPPSHTTAPTDMADAAKNALSSIFDKTKDVLSTAAETTKGYASQAQTAIGKIIPGVQHDQDPSATVPPAGEPPHSVGGSATLPPHHFSEMKKKPKLFPASGELPDSPVSPIVHSAEIPSSIPKTPISSTPLTFSTSKPVTPNKRQRVHTPETISPATTPSGTPTKPSDGKIPTLEDEEKTFKQKAFELFKKVKVYVVIGLFLLLLLLAILLTSIAALNTESDYHYSHHSHEESVHDHQEPEDDPSSFSTTTTKPFVKVKGYRRLNDTVIPTHYNLKMKVMMPGYTTIQKKVVFEGLVRIEMITKVETDVIELHSVNLVHHLEKSHVFVNGTEIPFKFDFEIDRADPQATILLKLEKKVEAGTPIVAVLHYSGKAKNMNKILNKGNNTLGPVFLMNLANKKRRDQFAFFTQFEPTAARRMVPCFDEPHLKTTWNLTLIHPTHLRAVSNAKIAEKKIFLVDSKFTPPSYRRSAYGRLCQKFSHVVIGHVVTMTSWEDSWFKEAFANFFEAPCSTFLFQNNPHIAYRQLAEMSSVMKLDRKRLHPIVYIIKKFKDLRRYHDDLMGKKGGLILSQIEKLITPAVFQTKVKEFVGRFASKTVESQDVYDIFKGVPVSGFSNAGNIDLSDYMEQWTTQALYPIVTVTKNGKEYELSQNPTEGMDKLPDRYKNPKHGFKWDIPIVYQKLGESKLSFDWLRQNANLKISSDRPLLINADGHGYYEVNQTTEDINAILKNFTNSSSLYSEPARVRFLHNLIHYHRKKKLETKKIANNFYAWVDSEKGDEVCMAMLSHYDEIIQIFKRKDKNGAESLYHKIIDKHYKRFSYQSSLKANLNDTNFHQIEHAAKIMEICSQTAKLACFADLEKLYQTEVLAKCKKDEKTSKCNKLSIVYREAVYCVGFRNETRKQRKSNSWLKSEPRPPKRVWMDQSELVRNWILQQNIMLIILMTIPKKNTGRNRSKNKTRVSENIVYFFH